MSLKSECLKFRIIDYISKGGISGLLNYPKIKNELLPTANEHWNDGENTIHTFDFVYYSVELITDKTANLITDQLEFYIESVYGDHLQHKSWIVEHTEINFLDVFLPEIRNSSLIKNAYSDGEEIVFFLHNGMNIHFNKYMESYLIKKIVSNNYLTHLNRELIEKHFNEMEF